jgi:hypothetical protein
MKTLSILLASLFCLSFCPSTEKVATNTSITSNGFYITVKDLTNRTYQKYIVESKDSVNIIFNKYFKSEMELGDIDYPISIYNGKRDFYIARVNVFVKPNGEKNFKNLKYPKVYIKPEKVKRRTQDSIFIFERNKINEPIF